MFELPETLTLGRQIEQTLRGRVILSGELGNSPHKFVWYNRSREEFAELTRGKRVGDTTVRGRWMAVALEPGYVLLIGECGGRLLYHAPAGDNPAVIPASAKMPTTAKVPTPAKVPAKYHLLLRFEDGTALSAMTTMWGAMELYESGRETERQYVKDMRPTPADTAFTLDYFERLIAELIPLEKRSVKSLLTQGQLIPGLGNAIAQDILFNARLHPRRPIAELDAVQRRRLYAAIMDTLAEATRLGGRYDERDLFNQPGGYVRLMDQEALKRPCPVCGGQVEKLQYLGGACYLCPRCQE